MNSLFDAPWLSNGPACLGPAPTLDDMVRVAARRPHPPPEVRLAISYSAPRDFTVRMVLSEDTVLAGLARRALYVVMHPDTAGVMTLCNLAAYHRDEIGVP